MTAKETNKVASVIEQVLATMPGERWEELRTILSTKGLQALIAETSLEETKIIQARVAALCEAQNAAERDATPLFVRFQKALQDSITQATQLPWPALHHTSFDT